jgi:hypothetical protein
LIVPVSFGAVFFAAVPLAAAQAMPVATFLQKADALQAKGMMALFSSDYKLLKDEVTAASEQLGNERKAAKAAGRPQAYCPPEGGVKLGSKEILDTFRTIPAAQRARTDVKQGMRLLLARKFPCRR